MSIKTLFKYSQSFGKYYQKILDLNLKYLTHIVDLIRLRNANRRSY